MPRWGKVFSRKQGGNVRQQIMKDASRPSSASSVVPLPPPDKSADAPPIRRRHKPTNEWHLIERYVRQFVAHCVAGGAGGIKLETTYLMEWWSDYCVYQDVPLKIKRQSFLQTLTKLGIEPETKWGRVNGKNVRRTFRTFPSEPLALAA